MFAFGETVTLLGPGSTEDAYGNTVEDWSTPLTVATVDHCGVEPRPGGETYQNDRNAVTDGFTIYDPSNALAVAKATHRLEVRGKVYPLLGQPAVWSSPLTGWAPGTVVQVGGVDG